MNTTGFGTGPRYPAPRDTNACAWAPRSVSGYPCVITSDSPCATESIPSVGMSGVSRAFVTRSPLVVPHTQPAATPAAIAEGTGNPSPSSLAVTTPPRPIREPTERSIPPPPVRMTMASPTPTAAMNEKLRATSNRLSGWRKRGAINETPAHTSRSAA